MFVRRRPLMRAAMVGGAAYYTGKRAQERQGREDDQEYRLQQLEQQQYSQAQAPAPAPAPAAGGMTDDTIQQLQKLGELRDSGVLTDEEFDAQKRKLLGG
jgi:putative oligomerization/nucleic acid binding protein